MNQYVEVLYSSYFSQKCLLPGYQPDQVITLIIQHVDIEEGNKGLDHVTTIRISFIQRTGLHRIMFFMVLDGIWQLIENFHHLMK